LLGSEVVARDHLRGRIAGVVVGSRLGLDRRGDDRSVDEQDELAREGVRLGDTLPTGKGRQKSLVGDGEAEPVEPALEELGDELARSAAPARLVVARRRDARP
jgi:hypothetical protein